MSSANLNPNPVPVEPRARFDLKKHVHEERPFFSGVRMFVSVVFSAAALAVAVAGGGYLLLTGPPSDFYQKPVEIKPDTSKPNLSPVQEKSLQEKVSALFDDYKTGWNSGSFPSRLVLSGFFSKDMVGKSLTSPSDYYDSKQNIEKLRVASIDQVTTSEISVTVDELVSYDTGIKHWFDNAGGTDQDGDLVVKRIIESEYRLIDSGGWKIKSKEWKRQTGALIQQASDADLSLKFDEGDIQFDDKRPSKQSLDRFYQSIVADLQSGSLSYGNFPSYYQVKFDTGGSIGRDEIQGRLNKLRANVTNFSVSYTIQSVEQTGTTSATATVRYSAQFVPIDSPNRNSYVAVWVDEDTWTRAKDTDTEWHREGTTRLKRSPIWQHYEAKTPPTPTGSSVTSTSNNYATPPSSGTGLPNGG